MKRSHVLFLFLLALHLIELPKLHATEVMWDYSKDIIYHEGKLYYPDQSPDSNNGNSEIIPEGKSTKIPKKEENDTIKTDNEKSGEENVEEEELATGGQFWFCIFMITGKKIFLFFMKFFNLLF